MAALGTPLSSPKSLATLSIWLSAAHCPATVTTGGVTIGKPDGSGSQPIQVREVWIQIACAIVRSRSSSELSVFTTGSKGADA